MSEQPPSPSHQPPRRPPGEWPGGSYQPGLGTQPNPYAAAGPSPHRGRNILLASAGGCALLLIGAVIGAAASSKPAAAPAPTVTVTAAAAPAHTVTVTVTVTRTARAAAAPSSAATARSAPSSSTLTTFSGTGIRDSSPFVVNSSVVTATYTYDCSAFGGTGNFIADLVTGSPGSQSYDDESIANQLGSGGSQTTTVYPADQGAYYHLEVNSECSWAITLTSS